MKIGFVGKGGSGKTTTSALFARYLAQQNKKVIAIDADINQHLAVALGVDEETAASMPALGYHLDDIKDYLAGDNETLRPLSLFKKTSLPGKGSQLLRTTVPNPIFDKYSRIISGVRVFVTGVYAKEDVGVACYHSKQGGAEILLNHLYDTKDDYVITDLTAGADSFASGIFAKFDVTFLVVEPTVKSIGVYKQYKEYAKEHNIRVYVIGNKIDDETDVDFIKQSVGSDYLAAASRSSYIKKMERGDHAPLAQLEPTNLAVMKTMQEKIDSIDQNWDEYYQRNAAVHRKKAAKETDIAVRTTLLAQADGRFQPYQVG